MGYGCDDLIDYLIGNSEQPWRQAQLRAMGLQTALQSGRAPPVRRNIAHEIAGIGAGEVQPLKHPLVMPERLRGLEVDHHLPFCDQHASGFDTVSL